MKKFILDTWQGIKKGLSTPNLPENILSVQRKPLIRIIRVLGGISTLRLLGQSYFELHGLLLYFCIFFAVLFLIYHIYISFHRFKYIRSILKTDKLDVRNSPLNRYSSLISRILFCAKGLCEDIVPLGVVLGIGLSTDQILKDSGRDPFFGPLIGAGINKIFPPNDIVKWRSDYMVAIKNLNNARLMDSEILKAIKETKELNFLSENDKKEFVKFLSELKISNNEDIIKIKSVVEELLKNKSNKP